MRNITTCTFVSLETRAVYAETAACQHHLDSNTEVIHQCPSESSLSTLLWFLDGNAQRLVTASNGGATEFRCGNQQYLKLWAGTLFIGH